MKHQIRQQHHIATCVLLSNHSSVTKMIRNAEQRKENKVTASYTAVAYNNSELSVALTANTYFKGQSFVVVFNVQMFVYLPHDGYFHVYSLYTTLPYMCLPQFRPPADCGENYLLRQITVMLR